MRPQDLVGAISNEADVDARTIGEIVVGEASSRVQVPAVDAPRIIDALRKTKLRGRRFRVDVHRPTGLAPTPARGSVPTGQRRPRRNRST
jgi:ATP-dependent RNA helicase DeaD